jgi:hypothetical protein
MTDFSSSVGDWVLCQSQRSEDTNRDAGNDDVEVLEDRAAKQRRHILTLPRPAQIALTDY